MRNIGEVPHADGAVAGARVEPHVSSRKGEDDGRVTL